MSRPTRQILPRLLHLKIAGRCGGIAGLTATLLLGGCAQTTDLLPSLGTPVAEATSTPGGASGGQSELEKATAYWGDQYAKRPAELKPALSYAQNLKAMGDKRKALAVLQQASVLHSADPELAGEYGRLALEFDQVSVADKLLAIADTPSKPDWRVISARGTVLAKQGRYDEALPFYERAQALSQNHPSVMNNMAMAYAMLGDAKKAEDILRQASNTHGAPAKLQENLALVVGLQGRYDESKSIAAVASDPASAAENADYLRRMVKVESKPAASSASVAVARNAPVTFKPSTADKPSEASASWQTQVARSDVWSNGSDR